jgi:YD repeat-containing protein
MKHLAGSAASWRFLPWLTGLALLAAPARAATNGPVSLSVTVSNALAGAELVLGWTGPTNAVYRIHHRLDLGPHATWQAFDATPQEQSEGRWSAPLQTLGEVTGFFRLELPGPEIFRVEPAVGPAAGGGLVLVVGQCLGTTGQVRIGGVTVPAEPVEDGSVYRCVAPALPEGVYDVDWLEGGQVKARGYKLYSVTAEPTPVSQRLLEPPEEPPASPAVGQVNNDGCPDVITGIPAALKVKEKGNRTKCGNNLRLLPSTGELQWQEADLAIPGVGLGFTFVRTYRSRSGSTTPMGHGWDHSYNVRISNWDDATGHFDLWDGTGRSDRFFRGTNGVYSRNEFFCEATVSNQAFTVRFADTGRWEFHPFDGTATAGRLARIVDRNGNTITLNYDGGGRVAEIVDTLGRTNRLTYNAGGQISTLTDFTGRTVTYQYFRAGEAGGTTADLKSVTTPPVTGMPNGNDFPAGKTTTYAYATGQADERLNHDLVRITDPKGQTWLQVVYRTNTDPASVAFDNVDYIQRGPYRSHLRRGPQSPAPANGFAVVKCILKDGAGNVIEEFYDSLNRCVRRLDYTGRANPDLPVTENQNRPANKLRADDPDFFETRFEWNLDSLCTRVVRPRGNEMRFIYERDFNPAASPRKKGDLRVLREVACCGGADADGDGVPDVTERVWRIEHDPRFGSPVNPRRSGPFSITGRGTVATGRIETGIAAHDFGSIDNAPEEKERGFVTAVTDPLGTVTTCVFDDRGNLTHTQTTERKSGAIIAADYDYNARGQPTVVLHPEDGEGRRRRDEFFYHDTGAQAGYLAAHVQDCVAAGFHLTNRYEYDARGNLTRHVDARGFDQLWTYNALDQVVVKQSQGVDLGSLVRHATTFTYDANDNLVQVDHENRNETGALDPLNPHWTSFAEYDALDRQTLVAHELAHVAQQRSMTNRFAYDANDNLVLVQLPEAVSGADPNNAIACQYDERDLLFQVLPAPGTGLGATDRLDYDANGNCKRVSKIDAFTIKQTMMDFDGFDRCVRVTDALGNAETFAFDAKDNLTYNRFDGETNDVAGSAGNLRLREARYEYDGLGRLTRRIGSFFDIFTQDPIGDGASITRFTYAPNGQLTRETDDNGHSTAYRYDSAGRLSGIARGILEAGPFEEGVQVCAYTYDAAGNLLSETQTDRSDLGGALQNFVTTYEYDGLGRLVRSVDNVGNTNLFAYDSRDNCVSEIDPTGNETVRVFDGLNRCVQTTAYEGTARAVTINTSHVEYQNRRCLSRTDGNGNTTTYAYDSLDRHVRTTHPDGTTVSLVWSPRSNLQRLTDANGTVIQYSYDLLDRCVRKDIAPGSGVAAATTFEEFAYDGRGNLVFGTNDTSMVEFAYNCGPSKEEVEAREKAKADCIAARAAFDGEGNCTALTYPDGREVRYAYDSLNRVTNVSQFAGGVLSQLASYAYDGPGRLARISRANGINTRINWNGVAGLPSQIPGDFGWQQVSRINHARAGGNPVIDQRVFAYDRAQNKTLRGQTSPYVQGAALATNLFAYDKAHRLQRAVRVRGAAVESDNTYLLDAMGNRTNVIGLGSVGVYGMDATLPEPGDFQMNQYTLTPFGTHEYDRNGNVVFIDGPAGGTAFHYDYADRLVRVERAAGPASVPVVSFTYDPLGRRITKTTYPPAPLATVTTRFYHDLDSDGDDLLEFQVNGATVASFILPEVDDEVLVAFTAGGGAIYFHQDDLGSVLALTDDKGNVLERYDYDDYGAPLFLDAKGAPLTGSDGSPVTESPLGNPFLFHGMFWDAETGLYLSQRDGTPVLEWTFEKSWPRYFSPATGRFMTRGHVHGDPHVDFWNPRTFAGNNPWSAKVVEKATSGLKDTLKTQVRMAGGRGSKSDVYVWKLSGRSREDVYVWKLKKEEGGRHTPFHNKYRPQFYFRTTDVTGEIELESGREMVAAPNGDNPITRKRPGRVKYADITLKRGIRETTTGLDVEYRKLLDRGEAGDNVGLLLRQANPSGIRGHRDVGGYRAAVGGWGHCNGWAGASCRLIVPIAMDKGLRFAIREGGRTVGAGQVTEIIK